MFDFATLPNTSFAKLVALRHITESAMVLVAFRMSHDTDRESGSIPTKIKFWL